MSETSDKPVGSGRIHAVVLGTDESVHYEPSAAGLEDSGVVRAVQEYLATLEAGHKPDRQQFLKRYPAIAAGLADCLDALEFVHSAAPQPKQAAIERPPCVSAIGAETPLDGLLGDFRILQEIGRGGMGVVYEAEQISLGRRVALKVLPFAAALDLKQLQRFKNEAQAAAYLQHTNIVPVHYVGCERGVHFYAMQYIEGRTLAAVIQELRPNAKRPTPNNQRMPKHQYPGTNDQAGDVDHQTDLGHSTLEILWPLGIGHSSFFRTVATWGVQAAEALEHAHELGVIHRDIKPANLLVDGGGRLWITDFGLAHCRNQPGLTMTGDVLGTLRYTSPEQALAKRGTIDARSDVYSLGVTLYELLTLEPAYNGRDREELLRQITLEEPRRLRRLNPAVPAELETITLKAMAKEPKERYASAEELADDLQRFLAGQPIRARRARTWERAIKWTRRRPAAAALIAVSVAALLSIMGGMLWYNAKLSAALYDSLVGEAQAIRKSRESGYRANVFSRLKQASQLATPKKNLLELRQEAALCLGDFVGLEATTWGDFPEVIWCAALRPDGSLLAVGLDDGTVLLRHIPDGTQVARLTGHRSALANLAFRADGNELVSTDWMGVVAVWQVNDTGRWRCRKSLVAKRTFTLVTPSPVFPFIMTTALSGPSPFPGFHLTAATLTPDGRYLAASWTDSTVAFVDLANGTLASQFVVPNGEQIETLDVSPDGKLLAGGYEQQAAYGLLVWDVETRALRKRLLPRMEHILRCCFSPDSKFLASSHREGVALYDTDTFQRHSFERGDFPLGVVFRPDSQILAYGSVNLGLVRLWDTSRSRYIAAFKCPHAFWMGLSKDGKTLVAVSRNRVHIWDLAGASEKQVLQGHAAAVSGVVFSPDGQLLATCGRDHKIKVWSPVTGTLLKELDEFSTAVESLSFSPDSRILAAGIHGDGKIFFYDVESWKLLAVMQPLVGSRVSSIAFSADGQYFAAAGPNGLILWRVVRDGGTISFEHVNRLSHGFFGSICFSRDGNWLAWVHSDSGPEKPRIYVWDLRRAQPHAVSRARITLAAATTNIMGFCANSNQLVFVSDQKAIAVWDLITKQELQPFGEGQLEPRGINFPSTHLSADGAWYALGDRAVTIWDMKARKLLVTMASERSFVSAVGWGPDRELLAVGDYDGRLEIWNLPKINARLAEIGLGW
jgi:WD40 repeat protein/serine/threonine protein kinase